MYKCSYTNASTAGQLLIFSHFLSLVTPGAHCHKSLGSLHFEPVLGLPGAETEPGQKEAEEPLKGDGP